MHKDLIDNIIIMGDSLSDRGTLDHRKLYGVISMGGLSGLRAKHSPLGRFTNGMVWGDHLAAAIAEEFIVREAKKHHENDDDIADDVIDHDPHAEKAKKYFTLSDDKNILFKGNNFVRSYAEGGLSAASYAGSFSPNLAIQGARETVSTLHQKRELLLKDDEALAIAPKHKAKSLIIEWSGANDLITVNEEPTFEEVDAAVAARIENVKELYKQGYRNFALVNLPDLSLTPYFQDPKFTDNQRENAKNCIDRFNSKLLKISKELNLPDATITILDAHKTFNEVYANPEKYFFDKDKLKKAFVDDHPNQKDNEMHTAPAPGYLFWDGLHPTDHLHYKLADQAYLDLTKKYEFKPFHESLLEKFRAAYAEKLTEDKAGIFGFFRRSRINYAKASVEDVLRHALKEKGNRTFEVIRDLGWVDKNGFLKPQEDKLQYKELKDAMIEVLSGNKATNQIEQVAKDKLKETARVFVEQKPSKNFQNLFSSSRF